MKYATSIPGLAWVALAWALVVWPVFCGNVLGPQLERRYPERTRAGVQRARRAFWAAVMTFEWCGCALALAAAAADEHAGRRFGLPPSSAKTAAITCVVVAAVFATIARFTSRERWNGDDPAPDTESYLAPSELFSEQLVFLAVCATAGICEEVMYRGVALVYLPAIMPTAAAVAISTLAFVYFHGGTQQPIGWMIFRAGFAIAMCALVLSQHSLTTAIVVHFIFDATLILPRQGRRTAPPAGTAG